MSEADRASLAGSMALDQNGAGLTPSEAGFDHGTIEDGIEQQSALNRLKKDQVRL